MPELPEVTTTVNGLQKVLPGLTVVDVWTDLAKKTQPIKQFKDTLKEGSFYLKFKKAITGVKVKKVERRAKNILIHLDNRTTILIHLKMTGHIIYGKYVYDKKSNTWTPAPGERQSLFDPYNRFVHVVFSLSNGKYFVLCDARKFGKVTLLPTDTVYTSSHLSPIGPEPLDVTTTFKIFKKQLLRKPIGNIKTVLMDQEIIAGIGNIYSDEMLWSASIHPESKVQSIPVTVLQKLYMNMKEVLNDGIDFGGDSTSDYRDINGMRGTFQGKHNAYRKKSLPCSKRGCQGAILRKVINGRSAHFCSSHQICYK